jgi:hypothetical protein
VKYLQCLFEYGLPGVTKSVDCSHNAVCHCLHK